MHFAYIYIIMLIRPSKLNPPCACAVVYGSRAVYSKQYDHKATHNTQDQDQTATSLYDLHPKYNIKIPHVDGDCEIKIQ
jgi:hypothetical protein